MLIKKILQGTTMYTVSDIQQRTVQLQTPPLFISSSLACLNSSYPYTQLRSQGVVQLRDNWA